MNQLLTICDFLTEEKFYLGLMFTAATGVAYQFYQEKTASHDLNLSIEKISQKFLNPPNFDESLKTIYLKNKRWLEKRIDASKDCDDEKKELIDDLNYIVEFIEQTPFKIHEFIWKRIISKKDNLNFTNDLKQNWTILDETIVTKNIKRNLSEIQDFLEKDCQKVPRPPAKKNLIPYEKTTYHFQNHSSSIDKICVFKPHRQTKFSLSYGEMILKISYSNGKEIFFTLSTPLQEQIQTKLRHFCLLLKGDEITHQCKIGKFEFGQLWPSQWNGGGWRVSNSNQCYEEIEQVILSLLKSIDEKREFGNISLIPRCDSGKYHIVELCAGKGILAKKISEAMKNLGSYVVSDLDDSSLVQAEELLSADSRFNFKKLNIVQDRFKFSHAPGIIIISGGLTERVLGSREEALRALKKCYGCLPNGGIVLLAGLRAHLLGPRDFQKHLPFDILNRTNLNHAFKTTRGNEFYILQKNCENEKNNPQVVNGILDLFISFLDDSQSENRLSNAIKKMTREEIESVKEVNLSDTDVRIEELALLKEFTNLKQLRLAGTNLPIGKDLADLIPPNCQSIDLSGTNVATHEIHEFVIALKTNKPCLKDIVLNGCNQLSEEQQIKWRLRANNTDASNLCFLAQYVHIDGLIETIVRKYLSQLNFAKLTFNGIVLKNSHFEQWCLETLSSIKDPWNVRLINPCDGHLECISFFEKILAIAKGKVKFINYRIAFDERLKFVSKEIRGKIKKITLSEEVSFDRLRELFPNLNSLRLKTGNNLTPFFNELKNIALKELDLRDADGVSLQFHDTILLRLRFPFLAHLRKLVISKKMRESFLEVKLHSKDLIISVA